MRISHSFGAMFGVGLLGFVGVCLGLADEAPPAAAPGTLVVIDAAGKEQKLKTWIYVAGTRRLAWLAPAEKEPETKDKDKPDKDKPDKEKPAKPAGPEALEFR